MKLDYLQFLDLEIFTRFGAKLEASMLSAIKRGRVLRELLKQDRLVPLSIEFQMAWMVAFNEGFLDEIDLENIQEIMGKLESQLKQSELTLDKPREKWVNSVMQWVGNLSTEVSS